ncbi:peptide ABC transporter substrate-binding protein [Culicoidibacter larvae]|uniref:Peptide ABC transporter substrate-binding protein n=2 Tax=Culicoidibacter larvae TaxID=2579976 RepID=A0A5R8QBF1_9FIRM|nr:peptide ABC transporter substrate-binding protein [Culicoidibacter larvae]
MQKEVTFMKKSFIKKLGALASIATAFALVLSGCGGSTASNNTLRLVTNAAPNSLNHIAISEVANFEIVTQYLEGLVTHDANGEIIGSMAESWTANADSSEYVFKIRDGVKWSDGNPVTAHDFVFGWQQLATSKTAPYGFMAAILKNGQDVIDGKKDASELGVKATSATELVVTLEEPIAYFLELMSFLAFCPLSEAFYNNVGAENYGTSVDTVLANGPFELTEYKSDEGWTYVKNANYWDAANVKLDGVDVRYVQEGSTASSLYDSGEIDRLVLTSDLVDKYKDSAELTKQPDVSIRYLYLSNNTATPEPLLGNKNFRAAIAHAIDKSVIGDSILKDGSIGADYLIPLGFAEYDGKDFREFSGKYNTPMFDVAKAQEYLEAAKKELGDTPLTFTIALPDTEANKKIYENIESQVEANLPGVDVVLNQVPNQLYYPQLYELATPAANSGWTPDYLDVSTYFGVFRTNNDGNFGQFSDARFDELYNESESAALVNDQTARWTNYVEAESILIDSYSTIPLYQTGVMSVVKPNIKGLYKYPAAGWVYKFVSKE